MEKAFIFDWSGTLSNNFDSFCQVYKSIAEELGGKHLIPDEIRDTFTIPYMKFWNTHFPNLTKEKQDELYTKFIHEADDAKAYPTTKETIQYLHNEGHKIFIVSSDPPSKLISETKEFEVFEFFTEIICQSHDKNEQIKYLLEKYNLDKENTFYIGDASGDVEEGKIAGVKTIGISWGFQSKEKLTESNPDFLIDDIAEIKNII